MTSARPTAAELRRGEVATWGARPGANLAERRRQAKLRKWTAHRSGVLLGFCSVELASGMIINDLKVLTGKNGPWIAMPSQKQLDRDGNPRLDATDKPILNPVIEFSDRATADRFSAMVVDLIRRAHPDALDDGSAL